MTTRGGTSFGDHKTYRLRKYYKVWIETTLLTASELVPSPRDSLRILQFRDNLKTPTIIDPGRIPCGDLQLSGKMSRFDDKVACLLVAIRSLVEMWWRTNEKTPGYVESLLIELDELLESWQCVEVFGNPKIGYRLRAMA